MENNDLQVIKMELLNDPTIRKLIKNSFFTRNQIEILVDYIIRKRKGVMIKTCENKITVGKKLISRETYYKIVRRAREKIAKTVITLMLLSILNIISQEQMMELLDVTSQNLNHNIINHVTDKIRF